LACKKKNWPWRAKKIGAGAPQKGPIFWPWRAKIGTTTKSDPPLAQSGLYEKVTTPKSSVEQNIFFIKKYHAAGTKK
jgi:hypothetical protein